MFISITALSFFVFYLCRDLRETRQRFDSVGGEIKRKDNQIRELQQRLECNEGCKCCLIYSFFSIYFIFSFYSRLLLFFVKFLFSSRVIYIHIYFLLFIIRDSLGTKCTLYRKQYFISTYCLESLLISKANMQKKK